MNPRILRGAPAAPGAPLGGDAPGITVSIVSHGQMATVQPLLAQLASQASPAVRRVVLTHNLPEVPAVAPAGGWPFDWHEHTNAAPRGFGANHNAAFAHCDTPQFCVLNPDIVLDAGAPWPQLQQALAQPKVACAYPRLLNADGSRQDQERAAPTPAALWRRRALGRSEARRDWVSAAFWLLQAQAFATLGGFDTRYYMYCEDTDFCLRLQLAGWRLAPAEVGVLHPAARRSHRDLRHLRWHLSSLLRLWTSPVLWRYQARPPGHAQG